MTRSAPVFRWVFDSATQSRRPLCVGELTQEVNRWEFVYDSDYLALGQDAWELDPTFIRTKGRSVFTRVGVAPPPVFTDVALSGWSLDALQKPSAHILGLGAVASGEPWGWWERLIYAPADGFGALFVGALEDKPNVRLALLAALKTLSRDSLDRRFAESSSGALGGERPKLATFRPGLQASTTGLATEPALQAVLLKFGLASDRSDSVVAEATALTLARGLGLQVPCHRIELFNEVPALCIERFDRGPGLSGPVQHCVSAATALDLVPGTDVEDRRRSYVSLRSKLKLPGDAAELFRRVVLNAVVGNNDDHPWNTSLRQLGLGTWALSPLYDVLPFFHRAGCPVFRMAITRGGLKSASLANLVTAGKEIAGLHPGPARAVIDEINGHVRAHWRAAFGVHSAGLPTAQLGDWASVFECDWLRP